MAPLTVAKESMNGIYYYRGEPDGTPYPLTLICIHGWACSAADFLCLFSCLGDTNVRFRAIAVDLPGHGDTSSDDFAEPSIGPFAGAVLSLLTALSIDKVILAGHSMGVRLILEAWRQATTIAKPTINGLVFIDGSHFKLRKPLLATDRGDPRSRNLSREERVKGISYAFSRMFGPNTPEDFRAATLERIRNIDLPFTEKMRKSFIDWDRESMDDTLAALGRSGLHVLSFQATTVDDQGQRIPLQPGEVSAWMECVRERVPQAQQIVVEDSMHFPHVDQPAFVAEKLVTFIHGLIE